MVLKQIKLLWILSLLLMSACSRSEGIPTEDPPTFAFAATEPVVTPSPTPTATIPPTATPEPTPSVPALTVDAQPLTEDGRLTIDNVAIPDDGWLVIYQDMDGELGDILGHQAVTAGNKSNVTVFIAPRDATPILIAALHTDAGAQGEFEYPGPDTPLEDDTDVVTATFQVDIQLPVPAIDVVDQLIAIDGLLHIDGAFTLEPAWLVIHNLENGKIGPAIGQTPLEVGQNDDLVFPIQWRVASLKLIAVLHEDKEQPGGFDSNVDLPILDGGAPIVAEFDVTLPPDIFVFNQPLVDGKIILDRVISDGPGWVAAYLDDEGQPGLIIGFSHLEDGVNEKVEIDLPKTTATPRLFLILHEDSGNEREFDFPAADLPIIYEGQLLTPFVVQTNSGNYLITSDQPLGDQSTVTVPLVAADLDTWLVIYNVDETGERGEIIGQTWLPAGINRNVQVAVRSGSTSEPLLAVLHQDSGNLEQFDFPGGADVPLVRNLLPVQSPFTLMASEDEVQSIP